VLKAHKGKKEYKDPQDLKVKKEVLIHVEL
jgi:hypothetical protein